MWQPSVTIRILQPVTSLLANEGGFMQEVTGGKPSPSQPTMGVVQIGRAAGLYVPDLP